MAISAVRDDNRKTALIVTSNADGVTPIYVCANPSTHAICASDGVGGSGFSYVNAERDANRVPVAWGVSSSDGVTPVPIYADSSNNRLLIQST